MQTVIHSFTQSIWKFMVVADINSSTGMCLLDLYATFQRDLTRADLKRYTLDELLEALGDVQMRNQIKMALRECKRDLIADHSRELRFVHILNQALHTIKSALGGRGSEILRQRRIDRARRRLFCSLYKMDIVRGFRFEMAKKLLQCREEQAISQLFIQLNRSRNVLSAQVGQKCQAADFDTWQSVSSLAAGHFNQAKLQKHVSAYSSDWINLRSFVVERSYLSKIHHFCDHFVDDKCYRDSVIGNETLIFQAADKRQAG